MNFYPLTKTSGRVIPSVFWAALISFAMVASGCSHRPVFPDQLAVPTGHALPFDGTWRLLSGNTGSIFRLDKGRLFFYERRKPLPNNLFAGVQTKDPRIRTAADLSARPGGVIVRDIRETNNPLIYTCQSASYDPQNKVTEFGPGEIKLISSTRIALRTLPNARTGLGEKIEEIFLRENLDNQSWFEQSFLKPAERSSQPTLEVKKGTALKTLPSPPVNPRPVETAKTEPNTGAVTVENRTTIAVPLDKMETNGKLSKSARDYIVKTVKNARHTNGSVEILYPLNAPDSVINALANIGVEARLDESRKDYELTIITPEP